MAGIIEEVAALEFDLACTLRLQHYDNSRDRDMAKTIGAACAAAMLGEPLGFDGDNSDDGCVTV